MKLFYITYRITNSGGLERVLFIKASCFVLNCTCLMMFLTLKNILLNQALFKVLK